MDSAPHRPDGALDLLSLGALVTRFDPGVVPFRKADHCDIHVSGGEFNVAATSRTAFGMRTGIASAMVDYRSGSLVAERVRSMGVVPFYRRFPHDGVTGPNIATVYSDRGHGVRAPVVFYNRANEAAARLRVGDFDWGAILARGPLPQRRGSSRRLSDTTPSSSSMACAPPGRPERSSRSTVNSGRSSGRRRRRRTGRERPRADRET